MQINFPQLTADQAGIQTISVGQVSIGPITVGNLVVNDTDFSLVNATATLEGVTVSVSIAVSLRWRVQIGLPWPIPDVDVGDTENLGSITFGPVPIGRVVIPGLNNVQLNIPSITAQGVTVGANPVTLQLQNAAAETIRAQDVVLPSAGFSVAGITLGSVQGSNVGVPAAQIAQASIGRLSGDPITIPSFTLTGLQLPAAQLPSLESTAPLDIPANLPSRGIGFDAGILEVEVRLRPSARSHVDHLEVNNARASATIRQVELQNVTLPYEALNLTLSQVGINNLAIPSFSVS